MSRSIPTPVMHFTHIDNLPTIIRHGLLSDADAQGPGLLQVEVGHREIKERRRHRDVPPAPGGVVSDYVPLYFAPRSPMLYVIDRGRVPTYDDGCDSIAYLVTSVERLVATGAPVVISDRNAVLANATFIDAATDRLDVHIDWDLMHAQYWHDTPDEPDRKERRMAECLVHRRVPWASFEEVVVKTKATEQEARAMIHAAGSSTPVSVRPSWYF